MQIQYETVVAPGNGVIFDSKAKPGVLSAGETIMKKLCPRTSLLKGDVWVTNKDIGYIKLGKKANVRVDAFDYTEFGEIVGEITFRLMPMSSLQTRKLNQYTIWCKN